MKHQVYLGLGTNLPSHDQKDLKATLDTALRALQEQIGTLLKCSSYITTQPWEFETEHQFLNAVAHFQTTLSPQALLQTTQQIERQMGRTQKSHAGHYHDRTIDIDILFYDQQIIHTPLLTIPHPLIPQRPFVLQPLLEITPDLIHPQLNQTIRDLSKAADTLKA